MHSLGPPLRPRLLRDRDASYSAYFSSPIEARRITDYITTPRSSWKNAYVWRVISSIRRECSDRIVILSERHLCQVLSSYVDDYQRARARSAARGILSPRGLAGS